ncbi:MAG: hypothetical protein B7X94_04125, partial [Hydrogenophilales bacterium 17-62-8]
MSSTGQVVGGVVGAVVGFYVGGPSGAVYGAQVGMGVGGLIDPPKVMGPRLDDLTAQTSTYGAFIPRIYGTAPVVGNVFWIQGNKLIEREAESSGKGGPEVTNFEYFATFAVGLCEGPIDGVRRIWIGGQLWYDAGSNDMATIIASNESAALFTLYNGSDTQLADPLIQADRGVANVPAYRGLAYIVFNELPVKDYGNSLAGAQVKVEVVSSGTNPFSVTILPTLDNATWSSAAWDGSRMVLVEDGGTKSQVSYDLEHWQSGVISSGNWNDITYGGGLFCAVSVTGLTQSAISFDGITWMPHAMPSLNPWRSVAHNGTSFCAVASDTSYSPNNVAVSVDGITWRGYPLPSAAVWQKIIWNGSTFCALCNGSPTAVSVDGINWTTGAMPSGQDWIGLCWNGSTFCAVSRNGGSSALSADGITWTVGGSLPYASDWTSVAWNGVEFFACNRNTAIAAYSADGITWTSMVMSASVWQAVVPVGEAFFVLSRSNPASKGALVARVMTVNQITLSTIVQSECLKSDLLTASDIDVTDLTDQVRGYRVSSLAPLRGGVDPLRKAWPFDVIQHGYKIKFKRRGGASVATITSAELDARAAGT